MRYTIDKRSIFYLLGLTGLYLIIILSLLQWNNDSAEFERLRHSVDQLTKVEEQSIEEFKKRYDAESLEYIKIYDESSLSYWNKSLDASAAYPGYEIIRNAYKLGNKSIDISIPFLNKEGYINHNILAKIDAENNWKKIKETSIYNIKINDVVYNFQSSKARPLKWKLVLMLVLSFIYFISFLILLARILKDLSFWQYVTIYLGVAILFRVLFYIFTFKSSLQYLQIFSNQNSLNFLSPSIADYILNSLLAIFFTRSLFRYPKIEAYFFKTKPLVLSFTMSILSIAAYIYLLDSCYHIVTHSNIAMDIEKVLEIDRYSITVLVLLIINAFLAFLCQLKTIKLINKIKLDWKQKLLHFAIASLICIPLILLLDLEINYLIFFIFILANSLLIDVYLDSKRNAISWNLWWIMIYAAFLTTSIFGFGFQKKTTERQQYLDQLYKNVDSKILEELKIIKSSNEVNLILSDLNKYDFPTKLDREDITEYLEKSNVFKKIKTYGSYEIQLFDGNGTNLLRHQVIRQNAYLNQYNILHEVSPGIYFDRLNGNYVLKYEEIKYGALKNTLIAYISLSPDNLKNKNYDTPVVIYQNDKLLYQNNLEASILGTQYRLYDKGSFITNSKSVIISSPDKNPKIKLISVEPIAKLIKAISLFSYLFCLIAIVYILFLIVSQYLSKDISIFSNNSFKINTLRGRIQYSVVAIVIVSFIIIGVITVYFFSNEMKNNNEIQLSQKVETIVKDIYSSLAPAVDNRSAISILHNNIEEFSRKFDAEIDIYNPEGTLISTLNKHSNQRIPYASYVESLKTGTAVKEINKNHEHRYYIPITAIDNNVTALVGIGTKDIVSTREKILEFISTILNVYVFLFLLAGAIAISIATSITSPLARLSENIKRTKLGKKNIPLEWERKDEIGTLIKSYNDMVTQLDSSAKLMAKTERDMAWREMAQQVAHEIKNPLTPMKLSIQYLEKAIERDPVQAPELVEKVANTLIEQIDSLAEIAGEFSNFASMPKSNNEKVILNEIVETVHDLFRKREDMDINMVAPLNDIYVFADKNQLLRVLTNLMKNSIQAIPNNRRGIINITLINEQDKAIISVEDNGTGISEKMKNKVFTPYFTTKNSGTGLGLAISTNIIESFNGNLRFKSKEGEGTTFSIVIPLMHLRDNRDTTNRVFLD